MNSSMNKTQRCTHVYQVYQDYPLFLRQAYDLDLGCQTLNQLADFLNWIKHLLFVMLS